MALVRITRRGFLSVINGTLILAGAVIVLATMFFPKVFGSRSDVSGYLGAATAYADAACPTCCSCDPLHDGINCGCGCSCGSCASCY